MTSAVKTDITADLAAIADGQDNDAADVVNPLLELRGHIRAGQLSVSATDTHVKTLSEALVAVPPLSLAVAGSGADETLALALDEAALVTPDDAQTLANKTLVAPVIASFVSAAHDHSDSANGGQLDASTAFDSGMIPAARLPTVATGQAGILPAPTGGDADNVLKGSGAWGDPATGGGTVTEVGLSMPSGLLDVAGSPLAQDGVFSVTKSAQTANRVFAAPDGSNGAPAFRALEKADLPMLGMSDVADAPMVTLMPWTQLGTASANISLSSIPATYGTLLLQLMLRSTASATTDWLRLRFNGDGTSNYDALRTTWTHSALYGTANSTSTSYMEMSEMMSGATAPAGYFTVMNIWLHGYAVTGRPRVALIRGSLPRGTGADGLLTPRAIGVWRNTAAAINAIAISANSGNLAAGSRYALYGIK